MLNFSSDYIVGGHEKILEKLAKANHERLAGYGSDDYCNRAKEKIKAVCKCPEADVFFLVGGTQTNQIVISSILKPYEGVIAAESGHIAVHEAGAIESAGHKVLTLKAYEGKICASELQDYLQGFYEDENHEHMVFPGMVYISYPTEMGTLYTEQELKAIHHICQNFRIPFYIDGARMGYGLAADNNMSLAKIAEHSDVFYIGGTKVGALFGEAVVFPRNNEPAHFLTMVKQKGGLLAKGWLLGIQFDTLFTDELYYEISRHAVAMAQRLKTGLQSLGFSLAVDSPTNQQFVLLSHDKYEKLCQKVKCCFWENRDADTVVVRLATCWATREKDVEELLLTLTSI